MPRPVGDEVDLFAVTEAVAARHQSVHQIADPVHHLQVGAFRIAPDVVPRARDAGLQHHQQGAGVILFMSSSSGLHGVPMRSPYVAAKWGLIGLTKTLAMELGPSGVRVNAICPGAVEGDRMQHVLEIEANATGRSLKEMRQQYSQGVSLRRFVSPEDIADMAVFLSSEAARQVTGQALAVDAHTERMV